VRFKSSLTDVLQGQVLSETSCVVNLAGLAHVAMPDGAAAARLFDAANIRTTKVLVEAAATASVPKFIHLSSIRAIAGNAAENPVDDATGSLPTSDYGRSKRAAEIHVSELARKGVLAVSLRPPLIVGAEAKGNWAALQALCATGLPLPFRSVANRRSYVGIGTVADSIAHLVRGSWDTALSGNYCLAEEGSISLPDLISALRTGMGIPARLFPVPVVAMDRLGRMMGRGREISGLMGDLVVDGSRVLKTFGFRPPSPLVEVIGGSGRDYVARSRNRG
jgi:UDP-glucose 4-epimerase